MGTMRTILVILLSLASPIYAKGAVIYGVGVNNLKSGTAKSYKAWTGSLIGIRGVVDGVSFTYDVVLSCKGMDELTVVGKNELLASKNLGFTDGEEVTIEVVNINTPNVKFEGFKRFSLGYVGPADRVMIAGNELSSEEFDLVNGIDLSGIKIDVFKLTPIGSVVLRYVDFQFSVDSTNGKTGKKKKSKKGKKSKLN